MKYQLRDSDYEFQGDGDSDDDLVYGKKPQARKNERTLQSKTRSARSGEPGGQNAISN